jgi:hypothetical protein
VKPKRKDVPDLAEGLDEIALDEEPDRSESRVRVSLTQERFGAVASVSAFDRRRGRSAN